MIASESAFWVDAFYLMQPQGTSSILIFKKIIRKRWLPKTHWNLCMFLYLTLYLCLCLCLWEVLQNSVFPQAGPQPASGHILQLAMMFSSQVPEVPYHPGLQRSFSLSGIHLPDLRAGPASYGINEILPSGINTQCTSEKGQHSKGKCPI